MRRSSPTKSKQLQRPGQEHPREIKDYFTVSVKVKLVEPQTIPSERGQGQTGH